MHVTCSAIVTILTFVHRRATLHLAAASVRMGHVGRQAGTREVVLVDTPYVLIYRIEQRGVTIVHIRIDW